MNFTLEKSGLVAKKPTPYEAIYITQGDFRINLVELFSGNYLEYALTCKPLEYCNSTSSPIVYTRPYELRKETIPSYGAIKFVFIWGDKIVSVDSSNNF